MGGVYLKELLQKGIRQPLLKIFQNSLPVFLRLAFLVIQLHKYNLIFLLEVRIYKPQPGVNSSAFQTFASYFFYFYHTGFKAKAINSKAEWRTFFWFHLKYLPDYV
jgi:hypothetical protein